MPRPTLAPALLALLAVAGRPAPACGQIKLGVTVADRVIREGDKAEMPIPGAEITGVVEEDAKDGKSIAAEFQLRKGDLIRGIVSEPPLGQKAINCVRHLTYVLEKSKTKPLAIYVVRDGELLKLTLKATSVLKNEQRVQVIGNKPETVVVTRLVTARKLEVAASREAELPAHPLLGEPSTKFVSPDPPSVKTVPEPGFVLGVTGTATPGGEFIVAVAPGSAATRLGPKRDTRLEAGDYVTHANGFPLDERFTLADAVAVSGGTLDLTVFDLKTKKVMEFRGVALDRK